MVIGDCRKCDPLRSLKKHTQPDITEAARHFPGGLKTVGLAVGVEEAAYFCGVHSPSPITVLYFFVRPSFSLTNSAFENEWKNNEKWEWEWKRKRDDFPNLAPILHHQVENVGFLWVLEKFAATTEVFYSTYCFLIRMSAKLSARWWAYGGTSGQASSTKPVWGNALIFFDTDHFPPLFYPNMKKRIGFPMIF